MNRRAFLAAASLPLLPGLAQAQATPVTITGAGATFPRPVYERWGQAARAEGGMQAVEQRGGGKGVGHEGVVTPPAAGLRILRR